MFYSCILFSGILILENLYRTASDKYDKFHLDYDYKVRRQYSTAEVDDEIPKMKSVDGWESDESVDKTGWGKTEARVKVPLSPTNAWSEFKKKGLKSRNKTAYAERLWSFEDNRMPYQYADVEEQVVPSVHFPLVPGCKGASLNALVNQFKLIKIFKKADKDDDGHIDALFDTLVGMFF